MRGNTGVAGFDAGQETAQGAQVAIMQDKHGLTRGERERERDHMSNEEEEPKKKEDEERGAETSVL